MNTSTLSTSTLANLERALAQIHKQHGNSAIWRMSDRNVEAIDTIPSGCLGLDLVTGVGGYPRGRIVEVFGPESSGKTTLALHAIAECQARGGIAAFIDAEHALDPVYAGRLGVRLDDLLVAQPDTGEQALDICEQLVASGAVDLVVVDSVAALVPKAELEGDVGDHHVGTQARLMSQALRKLTGQANKNHTCVLFINQLRQKIGVSFGPSETTTGGNALKFYASLRLDVRRIGAVKRGEEKLGNRTRVRAVKNKLAPPFREVEFDITWGSGICAAGDLIDLGLDRGVLQKNGAWLAFGGENLGNGREACKERLLGNPELMGRVRALVQAAGLPAPQHELDA